MTALLFVGILILLGICLVRDALQHTNLTDVGYPDGQAPDEPLVASDKPLRVPCDPIDAIDIDDPTEYTLREQYKLMGDNRSKL